MPGLILRGVKPLCFSPEIQQGMDILIDDRGTVERIGYGITAEGATAIDAGSYYLSPGWIDLHTHIYFGVTDIAVDPRRIGPCTGVTALVDAGSAGSADFSGFKEYIAGRSDFPVLSFINLGTTGIIAANTISELDGLDKIDLERLVDCIGRHRGLIKGIKVRASGVILKGLGAEYVKLAKKVGTEVGLPIMVHVGEPLPLLEDILPILGAGDILTHAYHGKRWGIIERGRVIRQAWEAYERGVRFDVGHGQASFSFAVAEAAIGQGLKPFSISTDLHRHNIDGPVHDLAHTIGKLLESGLSLEEAIGAVSVNPAAAVGLETYETGVVGKEARFTLFAAVSGEAVEMRDSAGNIRMARRQIKPVYTVLGDRAIEAAPSVGPGSAQAEN